MKKRWKTLDNVIHFTCVLTSFENNMGIMFQLVLEVIQTEVGVAHHNVTDS